MIIIIIINNRIRIQSECGKIRTRKTPNTDTFHAVPFKHDGMMESSCENK